jgi:hypothetical protein
MINIEELTIKQCRELSALLAGTPAVATNTSAEHPMLGRRCLLRTYSAGVHIGRIVYINPTNSMEVKLVDALRLWNWDGGGLSLSDVANRGIKGGRLNATGEVYLTNVIEIIPTTAVAEKTYEKFVE